MNAVHNTPAFTREEVLENFLALLQQMDFERELHLLQISRMRFVLRRRLKSEWLAALIGLWRLALDRSFPQDGDHIFALFLEHKSKQLKKQAKIDVFTKKVSDYVALFHEKGDADFSLPAEYLIAKLRLSERQSRPLRMRLILHLRELYKLVFERLI